MSSQEQSYSGANQAQFRHDVSKVVSGDREIKMYSMTNDGYTEEDYAAGLVLGIVETSGEVKPFNSLKTNGQEYPCAVLADDFSIGAGETKTVAVAIRGTLRTDKLSFDRSGDALTTQVGGRRVQDILEDRFLLRSPQQGTNYDNSIS